MFEGLLEAMKSYVYSHKMKIFSSISGYRLMPGEENGINFSQKFVADNMLEIVRESCGKAVQATCDNFDDAQTFTFNEPNCGGFTVNCGPRIAETYFDPTKNIPTVTSEDVYEVAFQGFDNSLSPWRYIYNSLPNMGDLVSEAKDGIMDTVHSLFNQTTNSTTESSETEASSKSWRVSLGQSLGLIEEELIPEKTICPWQDYQCHYDSLSAEFAECEGYTCYWEAIKEYLGQYDYNAIMQDIYENYLPDQEDTIKIAVGTALVAAASVTSYLLYRRYRNAQKSKDEGSTKSLEEFSDCLDSPELSENEESDAGMDEFNMQAGADDAGKDKVHQTKMRN